MKKIHKRLIIRLIAALLAIVLIFLSPCAKYLESSKIDTTNAAELVIAGEAAVYVTEWLVALLATVGLGSVAYENRDAIVSSYKEYLEAQIDTEMFIIDSVKDTCIQVYDKTSNTVQKIPWQTLLGSMHNCQHIAANNFPGIYVKYCPELLESFNEYTAGVLNGNVHVDGVSDALIAYPSFSDSDLEAQWDGSSFDYKCYAEITFENDWGIRTWTYDCYTSEFYPIAGYLDTKTNSDENTSTALCFQSSKFGSASFRCNSTTLQNGKTIYAGNKSLIGTGSASSINNGVLTFNANFPVFATYNDAIKYLKTGNDYENALNYGTSIYDDITEGSDLPSFNQPWQQELWERVANAPDCGIGSYGSCSNINDWANDIPWISLDSLMNYARTLLDTYYKLIDDILNGIYDSNKEPPATYSDAWDDTISDGWDDVVEESELPDENGDGETSGKDESNDNEDTETITTNLGNEIDVTPSKNHSVTTENPGPDGEPNSSVDIIDKNGNIKTRRWFGEDGKAIRDVDMTNHGNCSEHPEWPHEHIWDWSQDPPRQ